MNWHSPFVLYGINGMFFVFNVGFYEVLFHVKPKMEDIFSIFFFHPAVRQPMCRENPESKLQFFSLMVALVRAQITEPQLLSLLSPKPHNSIDSTAV